jgi:dihydroneopterin aldolase
MAIIALENIQLYGKHGCYDTEAVLGGHYELDVFVKVDITEAAQSDDLTKTVDYEQVYNFCIEVFSTRHNLIESLAYQMAEGLLDQFDDALGVRVKISKIHPPLPGQVGKSTVDYHTVHF